MTAEPVAHMLPSDLARFGTSETTGMAFSVAVSTPNERSVPLYLGAPLAPDFEAVKGKRMSELTLAQQDDAQELWLRANVGYFTQHVVFLLRRLDEARGVK